MYFRRFWQNVFSKFKEVVHQLRRILSLPGSVECNIYTRLHQEPVWEEVNV